MLLLNNGSETCRQQLPRPPGDMNLVTTPSNLKTDQTAAAAMTISDHQRPVITELHSSSA
jgi:hypothetical protein